MKEDKVGMIESIIEDVCSKYRKDVKRRQAEIDRIDPTFVYKFDSSYMYSRTQQPDYYDRVENQGILTKDSC